MAPMAVKSRTRPASDGTDNDVSGSTADAHVDEIQRWAVPLRPPLFEFVEPVEDIERGAKETPNNDGVGDGLASEA